MSHTLGVLCQRSLLKSKSHRFSVFFQKFHFYQVLHLGLWSIVSTAMHVLWSVHRSSYFFLFFAFWYPIALASIIERTVLSSLNCLCTFVKNQLTIYVWVYFWILFCSIKPFVYLDANTTLSLLCLYEADSDQWGPCVVDATNKFTRTAEVLWRKRDGMASLWVRERPDPCLDRLLLLFWEHYLKEGLHSSLSRSNDQTIGNIERTMRAYSESGSVS